MPTPRPWRVMRIIARLNMGGPAYHVSVLSSGLAERGFDVRLVHGVLPRSEGSLEMLTSRYHVHSEVVPSLSPEIAPRQDAAALRALIGLMRAYRPDVVHTHTAKAGFLGRAAAATLRPRPKIVHTYHGHVLEGYFGPLKAGLYRNLERACGLTSDVLIGVSQATVDDLVRLKVAPARKFRAIPIGIELAPFVSAGPEVRARYRAEIGVADEEVLLSWVGRLVPIKRVDVLLRAFAALRGLTRVPVRLALVGDGELRSELEALAADLGVADRVLFLGYRDDMTSVAAGADIAVLSSDNEGTPVSLIEAGAAGRPAVSTRVGGVGDVVPPEAGTLVPRGDHEAMAAALSPLVEDRARREQMGGAAREWVLHRFDARVLVDNIERLYEELLGPRR